MNLLRYAFSTNTDAPPPPTGSAALRFDADAPYTAITTLWAQTLTEDGLDLYYLLMGIATGAEVVVQFAEDHAIYVRCRVIGAPVDGGHYVALPVQFTDGAGVFTNNKDVILALDAQAAEGTGTTPPTWPTCAWYSGYGSTLPNINRLIVAPTVEPLTLEDAKLRAGLDWPPGDPRDAQMEGFIRAARERVERDTGYALLTQTREVYLSHLVHPAEFPAPARPIQSLGIIESPDPVAYPVARRIVVGWTDPAAIPPLLSFAVGLLTAHYATAARDVVVVGTITQQIPLGYEDAIADYRQVGV